MYCADPNHKTLNQRLEEYEIQESVYKVPGVVLFPTAYGRYRTYPPYFACCF